jgi:hypothetical protein
MINRIIELDKSISFTERIKYFNQLKSTLEKVDDIKIVQYDKYEKLILGFKDRLSADRFILKLNENLQPSFRTKLLYYE